MMKRIIIIITVSFSILIPVAAQLYDQAFTEFYNKTEFIKALSNPEYKYTGSPYLNSEYAAGEIHLTSGKVFLNIPLRYNIYNDVIEFDVDGKSYTMNENAGYKKVVIGEKIFVLTSYTYGGGVKKGHMEVLLEGNIILLKRNCIELQPPELPGAYKEAKLANFRNLKPEYFMAFPGKGAEFFNNEGSLEKICNCDTDDLNSFIKKNKIKFNKEESLILLFEYLNNK